MKQQYKGRKTVKTEKPTRPFDGLVGQLNRETLVLVAFDKARAFVKECYARRIPVDVGDAYRGGVIIYKK